MSVFEWERENENITEQKSSLALNNSIYRRNPICHVALNKTTLHSSQCNNQRYRRWKQSSHLLMYPDLSVSSTIIRRSIWCLVLHGCARRISRVHVLYVTISFPSTLILIPSNAWCNMFFFMRADCLIWSWWRRHISLIIQISLS